MYLRTCVCSVKCERFAMMLCVFLVDDIYIILCILTIGEWVL